AVSSSSRALPTMSPGSRAARAGSRSCSAISSSSVRLRAMKPAALLIAVLACASPGHWPPRPAEHPATPMELEFYDMAVHADDPGERAAFAQELTARHFRVVPGESRKGGWDVYLTHEGDQLVATLRSDGFF